MKDAVKIIEKARVPGTMLGLSPLDIRDVWEAAMPIFEPVLPKTFNVEAFIQTAAIVSMDAKLQECDALSVLNAAMNAATLALNLNPQLAEAYLVPYNVNKGSREKPLWVKMCQFQIGFNGYKSIGWRTGVLVDFHAAVVLEGDHFEYEFGSTKFLRHRPDQHGDDNRPMLKVYAEANLVNGGYVFEVLTKTQVEKLRMKNRDQKPDAPSGAWANYWSMAKAKATKPLFRNYLPLTPDLVFAISKDETVAESQLTLAETFESGKMVVKNQNPDFDEATQEHNENSIKERQQAETDKYAEAQKLINAQTTRDGLNGLYRTTGAWQGDQKILDMIGARMDALGIQREPSKAKN